MDVLLQIQLHNYKCSSQNANAQPNTSYFLEAPESGEGTGSGWGDPRKAHKWASVHNRLNCVPLRWHADVLAARTSEWDLRGNRVAEMTS